MTDRIVIVDPRSCRRLYGGHVKDCVCKLPNEPWWAQCPDEARGLLEPVPAPPPLSSGPAVPVPAIERPHEPARNEKVLVTAAGVHVVQHPQLTGNPAPLVRGGLAGEMCGECGSFNTRRTGTCIQCLDCYATGGCG